MYKILKLTVLVVFAFEFAATFQSLRDYAKSKVFINNDQVEMYAQDDTASFFVIGDWGGIPVFPFRTIIEQSISKEMDNLAKLHETQFQLALGDNFYFNGVTDIEDKRFTQTYEEVFNAEYLKDTPWFVLLGNHDHYGNASAQLEYTKKSNRWIFPSYNYSVDVKIDNGNIDLINIMMIDTILMCGNSGYDVSFDPKADVPHFETFEEKLFAEAYFTSIENKIREIGESDIPYFIVAGHFPVWSVAEHGPTDCLVQRLRPLLHKYNVSAYLSGHDHNLQHLSDTYLDQTVEYIVSGASNFVENSTKHYNDVPPQSLKFFWAENVELTNGGFCLFKATVDNMTITFVESNGRELYQTVILPRK